MNLINIRPGDKIASLVPVRQFSHDRSLMFATRKGVVKKTALSAYGNPRVVGINAINVLEGDELIAVQLADGRLRRDPGHARGNGDPLPRGRTSARWGAPPRASAASRWRRATR